MAKISKQSLTLYIILGSVVLLGTAKFIIQQIRTNRPVDTSQTTRSRGLPDARIKIVEYIDFECPACAQGALVLKEFVNKFPDQVNLQMRYFPLNNIHKHAVLSAQYAECAAQQGQFWAFQDLLVERQSQWKVLHDAKPAFENMAEEVKLNRPRLEACLKDERVYDFIYNDKLDGQARGVQSTPTYFINGEMVVGTKSLKERMLSLLQTPSP